MDDLSGDIPAQRQRLRTLRQNVPPTQRAEAAEQAAVRALAWLVARLGGVQDKRIGIFLSLGEELDTQALLTRLWAHSVQTYLPFVHARSAPLHWQPYSAHTRLAQDALGITAPADDPAQRIDALALDAVVVPLVGWDRSGQRIGMGGGFYDRTFAAKMAHRPPYLLGYAYACQEVVQGIAAQQWDVALDGLVTEQETFIFTGAEHA